MPPGSAATVAFAALTLAMLALWLPRVAVPSLRFPAWAVACTVAMVGAAAGHLVDLRGLIVVLVLAAACVSANRNGNRWLRAAAHALTLLVSAGLLLHVVPGFMNPRVLDAIRLTPDAEPYTKFLNFDKGIVGLFLLGLYVPERTARDPLKRTTPAPVWRFAVLAVVVMAVVVMALSLALGFVRWEPKAPSWWPMWVWSMVFLTALPEEAIFRGVAQEWLAHALWRTDNAPLVAVVVAGTAFGVAHLAGGPVYVVLATIAGIGYGWIYASTGSIAAAIATHAGLNTLHFLLFSYPALTASH
jgi:membrane protease YdiL (CAAX protease family)